MLQCTNTIYINNLNEKIKIKELKNSLQAVFGQFGTIVDIHVGKSLKMRGQAFLAFKEKKAADDAMRSMQGFPFFNKPLKIQRAKVDSDCIARLLGTYIKREKDISTNRVLEKKICVKKENEISCRDIKRETQQVSCPEKSQFAPDQGLNICSPYMNQHGGSAILPPLAQYSVEQPPNKILFLENLPPDANQMLLSVLFGKFPGFREIRAVDGRPEIAFAEFFDVSSANWAKNDLQGVKLSPTHSIKISFAKK